MQKQGYDKHNRHILRYVRKLQKVTINLVMSVRLFPWNNTTPTGRIVMEFDIRVFFENMSIISKFYYPTNALNYIKLID